MIKPIKILVITCFVFVNSILVETLFSVTRPPLDSEESEVLHM